MCLLSNTAVLVKIPWESESVSIIENNHVSLLKKESASCSGRMESGKLWAREKLERGRRRFELFGYCSWYKTIVAVQEIIVCWLNAYVFLSLQTELYYKSCRVYNLRFLHNDNINETKKRFAKYTISTLTKQEHAKKLQVRGIPTT